jgi:uncharacterized protein with ACT and thioredoxin-like domain
MYGTRWYLFFVLIGLLIITSIDKYVMEITVKEFIAVVAIVLAGLIINVADLILAKLNSQ